MTIKIKTACQVAGEHADEGALLVIGKDVDKDEAEKLVRMGRAEFVDKKAKKVKAAKPDPAADGGPAADENGNADSSGSENEGVTE